MFSTPLANRPQRLAESVLGRLALDHPSPLPGASPVVSEPQHREAALALRAAPHRLRRSAVRVLSGCSRRPNFSSRFASTPKHPPRIVFSLEDQHRVVGISDLKGPPPKPWLDLVLEPQVQHLVQIDVGKRRGYHAPLRGSPLRMAQLARLHHPGVQPLPYRSSYHSVSHPLVQKAPQVTPTLPKKSSMSRSITQPPPSSINPCHSASSASCAPRPGRNPHEHSRKSCS